MGRAQDLGAVSINDMPSYDAEQLVLVTDKTRKDYDPRVDRDLPEWFINSIYKRGVITPIIVRFNGKNPDGTPIVEVVDGRQRVRACRVANKRRRKDGLEPHLVPVRRQILSMDESVHVQDSANLRLPDDAITRAEKMRSRLNAGYSEADIAINFGISVQSVRDGLALLDLAPEAREAVKNQQITAAAARAMLALPEHKQAAVVEKVVAVGEKKGDKLRRVVEKATGHRMRKMRTAKEMREQLGVYEGLKNVAGRAAAATLRWALGEVDELEV